MNDVTPMPQLSSVTASVGRLYAYVSSSNREPPVNRNLSFGASRKVAR